MEVPWGREDPRMATPPRYDLNELLARLDGFDQQPRAQELRARVRELLRHKPGDTVLDVGCGAGLSVAEIDADGARTVGLDLDARMLDAARRRHPEGEFVLADAEALPLPDGAARAYRAERLFHAVPNPERALAEAYRVLAPGGRVVLVGQDWDSFMVESDDPWLNREVIHASADAIPYPSAPRRQPELLRAAGFAGVEVEGALFVFTDEEVLPMLVQLAARVNRAGAVGEERVREWLSEQRRRAAEGRMFVGMPFVVVSADRP